MALKVRFEPADEFRLAWSDYGLSDDALSLLKSNVARNPFIGKASTDDPGLRRYRVRQHVVVYSILDTDLGKGEVVIWLLDVQPVSERPSVLGRWARTALKGAAWILRIRRGDFPGDDDGNG